MSIPSEAGVILNQFNNLSTENFSGIGWLLGFSFDRARPRSEFIAKIIHSNHTVQEIATVCGKIGRRDIQDSLQRCSSINKPISLMFPYQDADTTSSASPKMKAVMEQNDTLRAKIAEKDKVIVDQASKIRSLQEQLPPVDQDSDVRPSSSYEMVTSESSSDVIDGTTMVRLSRVLGKTSLSVIRDKLEASTGKQIGNGDENAIGWLTKARNQMITKSQLRNAIFEAYCATSGKQDKTDEVYYNNLKDQLEKAWNIVKNS